MQNEGLWSTKCAGNGFPAVCGICPVICPFFFAFPRRSCPAAAGNAGLYQLSPRETESTMPISPKSIIRLVPPEVPSAADVDRKDFGHYNRSIYKGGYAMKRSEQDIRFQWDLTKIYPDTAAWEAAMQEAEAALAPLAAIPGCIETVCFFRAVSFPAGWPPPAEPLPQSQFQPPEPTFPPRLSSAYLQEKYRWSYGLAGSRYALSG